MWLISRTCRGAIRSVSRTHRTIARGGHAFEFTIWVGLALSALVPLWHELKGLDVPSLQSTDAELFSEFIIAGECLAWNL